MRNLDGTGLYLDYYKLNGKTVYVFYIGGSMRGI